MSILVSGLPARRMPRRSARPNPGPRRFNSHVVLEPVTPEHYPFLHRFETAGDAALGWRHRGQTPPLGPWVNEFESRNNLAEFLVVPAGADEAIGHVYAYGQNLRDGYCSLAAARFAGAAERASLVSPMLWGTGLFIEYLFGAWPMRRILIEAPEYNWPQYEALGDVIEHEGTLRGHTFRDGRYWDHKLLAIHREAWTESAWIRERLR